MAGVVIVNSAKEAADELLNRAAATEGRSKNPDHPNCQRVIKKYWEGALVCEALHKTGDIDKAKGFVEGFDISVQI